jgi:hypothetical protein
VQVNQLIQTVVREGNLVITISEQVATAQDWPVSNVADEFLGATMAANVMLDLRLLQGPSGIAALYQQMATAVRNVSDWWPLPLSSDFAALSPLP